MGLFEHWPYVNFHDLNLDWIIKEIPKVYESRDAAQASADASAESAAASQLSADASLASQEAAHQSELNAAQSAEDAAESAQDAADTVSNTLSQINLLQSRVDNIIPNGTQTEGNTELLDIRVAEYGTTYDSAGNAVRAQYARNKHFIDQAQYDIDIDIQKQTADDGRAYGKTYFNMFTFSGQMIDVTNNGELYIFIAFIRQDGTEFNALRVNPGVTIHIPVTTEVPKQFSIYCDTYPVDVHIHALSMSATLNSKIKSMKDDFDEITVDYLDGRICYANLSSFDLENNLYYSNNLTPIAPTDSNTYHIAPTFHVPAGTYSYYGIDSYWSFYVTDAAVKTRLATGQSSGTVTLSEPCTIYLTIRENITNYNACNFVSGNVIYTDAPDLGYFSEKINKLSEITQIMATVNMFGSVAAIGDSYTIGSVKNSGGVWTDHPEQSWIATMAKNAGVAWNNYGKGGATVISYIGSTEYNALMNDPAKDAYFIDFGINDAYQQVTLGTPADMHEDYTQNPSTFFGCYGKLISQLIEKNSNAKIILIKPWTYEAATSDYGSAVDDIGTHFSIPVINPYDDVYFASGLLPEQMNGGHPTTLGYSMMGIAMIRLFSQAVMNNRTYFKYSIVG